MVVLQGFASVNVNTEEQGASAQELTLEAQESRIITVYEHALALIQAQRPDEAQVPSTAGNGWLPTDRRAQRATGRGEDPPPAR